MDRKTIVVLVVCLALLMLWPMLVNKIFPPKPAPPRTSLTASATNQAMAGTNRTATPAGTNLLAEVVPASFVPPGVAEETLVVENADARYTFTSHGGGLKLAELKHYQETVGCGFGKNALTNRLASLNTAAPLPVLTLLGPEAVQGDGVFRLSSIPNGVRAEKALSNGLHLVKEFTLTSNYLVEARLRLENKGTAALSLPAYEWVAGTATPMGLLDDESRVGVSWYNGEKLGQVGPTDFSDRGFACMPRTPPAQIVRGYNDVVWASVHNQFFAIIVIPPTNTLGTQIIVTKTNLPSPSVQEIRENPRANKRPFGLAARMVFPPLVVAANQSVEQRFQIYAGPKEFNTLARLGAQFQNNVDLVMEYSGFFGFFAKLLLLSMNGLHHLLHLSYGLVIILITVLIKLLFWPLTQASTRSMKRMQALQPQMKAIQERFKSDPTEMNRRLMEFMKKNKVSPLGGCLPMLLQIPVFFGFYRMIQSAIELRGAQFLWACDLSKPDTLFIVPALDIPFNLLPLLMGVTMLWQARLTPASPGMDPMQQKIMKYMPLMFLFILYNFSAGLTLYWTVQNLLTIAQMKLTRMKDQPAGPATKAPAPASPPKKKR